MLADSSKDTTIFQYFGGFSMHFSGYFLYFLLPTSVQRQTTLVGMATVVQVSSLGDSCSVFSMNYLIL